MCDAAARAALAAHARAPTRRAQATNQRSFILLQQYLEQAESGLEPYGRAQAFRFEFWLRNGAGDDADDTAAAAAPGGSLRRVELTLPPPGRRQPGQDAGRCAPVRALLPPAAH